MPEVKAKAALQSVSAAGKSLEEWALSAIEWQTAQDDLEAEKNELEQAMQASLRQEEERKSQQTPLEQQSPEQLLAHFKGSLLLAALRGTSLEDQLFLEPLRLPVLRLLKLEQQSIKWYSSGGTRRYFEALAQECAASTSGSEPSAAAEALPSPSKRESKRRKKDAASDGNSKDVEGSAAQGSLPAPDACNGSSSADLTPFVEILHAKAAALETGLYQMPGTSGEVPAIFLDDMPDDEVEVGDVMEDDSNSPEHAEAEEEAVVLD
ncbi:g11467 [Coccomyxa elongata]